MKTNKPIIVFGSGRCGTTIFHRMFSRHPGVAWLSDLCERHPGRPELNGRLMKALDYAILNKHLRKRYSPNECYSFWEHHCRGFRDPCRDLIAADVSVKTKRNIQNAMSLLTSDKKNRLLAKITGWPRLGYLSEIFPDAKFIHIIRDGRAVANSLVNMGWWLGWTGPENWRWAPLSAAYHDEWFKYDQSFVVLAAIQWKILMDATENARKFIDEANFLEIKYEDLCLEPVKQFKNIIEFSELPWVNEFDRALGTFKLHNANHKWEQEFNDIQKKDMNEVLKDHLIRYGYL